MSAKYGLTHFETHLKFWVYANRLGNTGHVLTHVFVDGSAKASLGVWEHKSTQYLFTVWVSAKAFGSEHVYSHTLVELPPKVPCGPLFAGHVRTQVRVLSSEKYGDGQTGTHVPVV